MKDVFISICIPAYNRANLLTELLDSIRKQSFKNYEIVISEDNSPERELIRNVVGTFSNLNPDILIKYHENKINLGYDGNLRTLIELSSGKYCFFMGNDDLVANDALEAIHAAEKKYGEFGVVLRSYQTFNKESSNIIETFHYFPENLFFPAGEETVVTFYRRCVVISGLIIHRQCALKYSTNIFDGTLLYQLHLVGNILFEMNGIFLTHILALYRLGGTPDFGMSESEKGLFTPKQQTPESSIHFMQGMLKIIKEIDAKRNLKIYPKIILDLSNYSYPFIAIQANQPKKIFFKYIINLYKIGFGKSKLFYFYSFALFLFGKSISDKFIIIIKKVLGHTPRIGNIYKGEKNGAY